MIDQIGNRNMIPTFLYSFETCNSNVMTLSPKIKQTKEALSSLISRFDNKLLIRFYGHY